MRKAAAAWLAYSEGRKDEALELARAAADLDDKTGKHPVTPSSVLPPRELLGDMLREMGRNADALVEYETALRTAPNRLNGLYGAARSAELSGNGTRARELYGKLLDNCGKSGSSPEREEIRQARAFKKAS
jgi:tetratricopeptide (TPR) repeat protein